MKHTIRFGSLVIAFVLGGLFFSSTVFSGDKNQQPEMNPEAVKAMKEWTDWMQANPMTEKHSEFKEMKGTWNVKQKMWMYPGAEPTVAKGTATFTPILGGRFVHQEYNSSVSGMPFQGVGIEGYNTMEKRYENIWVDSMSNNIYITHGKVLSDGTKVYEGTFTDPSNPGNSKKSKNTIKKMPDGSVIFKMYDATEKEEKLTLELTYTKS